jgi:septum site-determining protein MinD
MAKVIVVTSGKGGVGKTTTSASFSAGLALQGHKTAVIDFDVGLRNLDLIMGCERRVVYDLINVIQGEANLNQALIKDKSTENLFILPASQTRDKDALTQEGVEKVIKDLTDMGFEYIVCDSPAGIESGALLAMHFADEALVVTNPEVSSVRDSDRILGILSSKTKRAIEGSEPIKEHLLITRYNPKRVSDGQMLSLEDIQEILRIKLIGAACVEPGYACHPSGGHRRGRRVSRRGEPIQGRRQAHALYRLSKAGAVAAHFRLEVRSARPCPSCLSSWGRRKRPPPSLKSAFRLFWRTNARARRRLPIICRHCNASWSLSSPSTSRSLKTTSRSASSTRTTWKCSK